MFLSYGIKKKDLETDLDFAFNLFKKVIVGLGSENKMKNSALDKIEHTFLPPAEREKQRKQEEIAEAKLNIKRTQTKRKPAPKKKYPAKNFAAAKRGSVPLAPPPPPPPPPPPTISAVPQINTPQGSTPAASKRSSMPPVDVATQLSNMKLKKVVKEEKPQTKNIQGNAQNFLQNALSTAIMNRRKNLHMHDDDNDDDDDDDWD